jgi:hypothetical protein
VCHGCKGFSAENAKQDAKEALTITWPARPSAARVALESAREARQSNFNLLRSAKRPRKFCASSATYFAFSALKTLQP